MAVGDILACRIASAAVHNGFVAEIDIEGLSALGSGAFALGMGTNNDPATAKIVFTVTSAGYDATGTLGTIARTVYGTQWVRKAYPDQASVDEAEAGGTLTTRVSLSDFIYTGDTVTVTIASGFYTGSNAVSGLAVTNNSTLAHPKVIGRWALAPFQACAGVLPLEVVAFHRSGRNGKPVAAVKFTVTDGTNTVNETVTAMTVSTFAGVGNAATNKVLAYIPSINASSFIQGAVLTCNFIAYPWVGGADSILDSSAGTAQPDERLGPHALLCDKDGTYGGGFAVVDVTNGQVSVAETWVYASQALAESNYAGDNTLSYKTIGRAAQAIKAWNNTNKSRNEPGGGTILLTGNHSWPGDTSAPSSSPAASLGAQSTYVTITRLSTVTRATANINAGTNDDLNTQRVKLYDITISGSSANQIQSKSATDVLWVDNCDINNTSTSSIAIWKLVYATRNSITALGSGWSHSGASHTPPALVRGNAGPTTAAGVGIKSDVYAILGNYNMRPQAIAAGNVAGHQITDNAIYAFNTSYGLNGTLSSNSQGEALTHGLAFVQNIGEKINGTTEILNIVSGTADSTNILVWHNTLAGQRLNIGYNDSGSTAYYRTNFSQRNNIFDEWNNKDDTFVTANAARVGSWPVGYNVGSAGNHKRAAASDEWKGEFFGLYNVDGGTLGFVDDASFNNGGGGDASGNGDYHLTSSASGYDLIPANYAVLPFDLAGTARNNDGGGSAGAFEMNAPPEEEDDPAAFEDLATAFATYIETLRDASALALLDSSTEVTLDVGDVRAAVSSDDDLNTAYAAYLS